MAPAQAPAAQVARHPEDNAKALVVPVVLAAPTLTSRRLQDRAAPAVKADSVHRLLLAAPTVARLPEAPAVSAPLLALVVLVEARLLALLPMINN